MKYEKSGREVLGMLRGCGVWDCWHRIVGRRCSGIRSSNAESETGIRYGLMLVGSS